MSEEPEHKVRTREMRRAMIEASDRADRCIRRAMVYAIGLGHTIEQTEPLRQALGWMEVHAGVTENSDEWEEVMDGVLP